CFWQKVIERLALGEAAPELSRASLQLVVGERLHGRLEFVDPGDVGAELLQLAIVLRAEDLREEVVDHGADTLNAHRGAGISDNLTPGLPRQETQRINGLSVEKDFVVQVRVRRAAGRADVTDDVATLDFLAGFHGKARHRSE